MAKYKHLENLLRVQDLDPLENKIAKFRKWLYGSKRAIDWEHDYGCFLKLIRKGGIGPVAVLECLSYLAHHYPNLYACHYEAFRVALVSKHPQTRAISCAAVRHIPDAEEMSDLIPHLMEAPVGVSVDAKFYPVIVKESITSIMHFGNSSAFKELLGSLDSIGRLGWLAAMSTLYGSKSVCRKFNRQAAPDLRQVAPDVRQSWVEAIEKKILESLKDPELLSMLFVGYKHIASTEKSVTFLLDLLETKEAKASKSYAYLLADCLQGISRRGLHKEVERELSKRSYVLGHKIAIALMS